MKRRICARIKEVLNDIKFHDIYKSIKDDYYLNVRLFPEELEKIHKLDLKEKHTLEFIVLGKSKTIFELESYVGSELVELLDELGMLDKTNNIVRMNKYSIISYYSFLVFVERSNIYISENTQALENNVDVYIGNDSARLSRYININDSKFKKTLDLCSGSGVQGIINGAAAEKAVFIELNPNATPIIEINCHINNIVNFEIITGDLVNILQNYKNNDLVTVNPPFFAVPKDLPFPICGNGGYDGMDIVKKIIEDVDNLLSENGEFYMVLEAIGNNERPFITEYIKSVCQQKNLDTRLIYHRRVDKKFLIKYFTFLSNNLSNNSKNYEERWENHFNELNVEFSYSTTIIISKKSSNENNFTEWKLY